MAGANVHETKLLAMTLDSIVVERPDTGIEHLCLDKGYDNPTGHEAVAAYGYRGHIRRIRRGEAGLQGRETLSGAVVGGGAYLGLAIQVPGDPGPVRQEGVQLHWTDSVGMRPALVPPANGNSSFEIVSKRLNWRSGRRFV